MHRQAGLLRNIQTSLCRSQGENADLHSLRIILGLLDECVLVPVHVLAHAAEQGGRGNLCQHGSQAGALSAHARKDLALGGLLVPAILGRERQAGCGLHHHVRDLLPSEPKQLAQRVQLVAVSEGQPDAHIHLPMAQGIVEDLQVDGHGFLPA